ncbi:MAG: hypothetical protein Q7R39_06335 [Dehalococcoidia bacterium]|nr:hypothetical protein [Dehalococcoidia bacterium]
MGPSDSRFSMLSRSSVMSRWLVVSGITLVLYVAAFSVPFFLGNHYASPQLTWTDMVGERLDIAIVYTMVIVGLFGLYYFGYRTLAAFPSLPPWAIYVPPVTFALALLSIYPPGGWDLFLYISQGRLYSLNHLNPFLVTPQDAPFDLFFSYASWWPYPSTYGPAWQMMAGVVSLLGGENLWLSMLVFKVMVTVFFFASVVLVYLILSRQRPEVRHLGAFLLAWNPLLLYEIAGNGHNDIVMAFFTLLSLYFLFQRRLLWTLPLLAVSMLIKYSSAILFPGVLWHIWWTGKGIRQRLFWAGGGLVLAAAVVFLFARPFGSAYSIYALFGLEELYRESPATLLYLALLGNFSSYDATNIVKAAVVLVLGTLYAFEGRRLMKTTEGDGWGSLLRFAFQVTFFFLLLIPRFHPWFVTSLLALGVLMVGMEPMNRAILLTFTAFLSHIVEYFVMAVYGDRLNYFALEIMATSLIFAPPLIYWQYYRVHSQRAVLADLDHTIAVREAEIGRLKSGQSRRSTKKRAK